MSAVNPTGVIVPWMGPTMMTASVAVIDASTQLTAASRCGEYPSRTAPFSLPAAALVARPNRVNWYTAHSRPARRTANSTA